MNIRDCSERKIICTSNEDNNFFGCDKNSPLLEVGKTYTVIGITIHSWHSEVELKEFPNVVFNSVCFEELEVSVEELVSE